MDEPELRRARHYVYNEMSRTTFEIEDWLERGGCGGEPNASSL